MDVIIGLLTESLVVQRGIWNTLEEMKHQNQRGFAVSEQQSGNHLGEATPLAPFGASKTSGTPRQKMLWETFNPREQPS